jgi:predicted ATPase
VDFLEEDTTNLPLVLQNTFISSSAQGSLNGEFKRFYQRFQRLTVSIFGNQVLLNMHEEGLEEPISAARWSDGMIRYLCLLAILCHPKPPSLICIDEPELGFHPDILPDLGRLIKEASERTQLIITTHSKQLVDEFSDDPAAVVVCERDFDGATRMERLDAERLKEWLERYTLGELWEKGEIGGDLY